MAQIQTSLVKEPFAEVDAWKNEDGTVRIKATIMMKPSVEDAQTGLAIDGSNSMADMFGHSDVVSPFFFGEKPNLVEKVAKKIAVYLSNFDSDGETTVIYNSCGKFGQEIQEVGDLDAGRAEGEVTDDRGASIRSYTDGLPAMLRFKLPPAAKGFKLTLPNGKTIEQQIIA